MTLLLRYQRCWELTKLARAKVFNVNNMLFFSRVIHGQFQEERETGKAYHKWGKLWHCATVAVAANCATHLQRGRAKNIKAQFQFQPQSSVTEGDVATKAFQTWAESESKWEREIYVSSVCKYLHTHTHAHCYLDSPCKSTKTAPNLARHHPVRIWTYYGVYYSLLELKFNWNKLCIYCRKSLTKWRICRLPCSLF